MIENTQIVIKSLLLKSLVITHTHVYILITRVNPSYGRMNK